MTKAETRTLTVEEVAARLHRKVRSVRTLIRRKEIAGFREGRRYLVRECDFDAYLAKKAQSVNDDAQAEG